MRHIISILIENESGALSRIAGLFTARGYNIESLIVAPIEDPSLSRMTLVTRGDKRVIEQIIKQLSKLMDVIKLLDLSGSNYVEREMLLIKVHVVEDKTCTKLKNLINIFQGKIIDVKENNYLIEITGNTSKLDSFVAAIPPENYIIELIRTGPSGITRGSKALMN